MEALGEALSRGLSIAAKISYSVFKNAVLKALFIIDEKYLVTAIEQNVDLLPLFLIYAPNWVKVAQGFASKLGRGQEHKITLSNALKWLKETCDQRKRGYYDLIVNLPKDPGSNPGGPANSDVFPPPGADAVRVEWFWGNVERLTNYMFRGIVPESSKQWAIAHLKWLKEQETKDINKLLEQSSKENNAKQETQPNV